MSADLHRTRCHWDGNQDQSRSGWFSLLDWAVYHAPGWEQWQEFRASLVGRPMEARAHWVWEWWWKTTRTADPSQELADAVRCVNVLRSLRGQFSAHPELKTLLDKLNPELEKRWRPSL